MVLNVEYPIELYNAKYHTALQAIQFLYICNMNKRFYETETYAMFQKISKEHNTDEINDIFEISVYYGIDDIEVLNEEISIKKIPEVVILSNNMNAIKLIEDIDFFSNTTSKDGKIYTEKYYMTKDIFALRTENIKI
jgi:hypothetical protein